MARLALTALPGRAWLNVGIGKSRLQTQAIYTGIKRTEGQLALELLGPSGMIITGYGCPGAHYAWVVAMTGNVLTPIRLPYTQRSLCQRGLEVQTCIDSAL